MRDSLFEDSLGFFGRWKSSHARLENNTFRGAGAAQLQMQMQASYFEGPVHISNISIFGNSFEVEPSNNVANATIADILETGPSCSVAEEIVQSENVVVRVGADP